MFVCLRWLSTIEGVPGEPSGFAFFEGKHANSMALGPFARLAKLAPGRLHIPGAKTVLPRWMAWRPIVWRLEFPSKPSGLRSKDGSQFLCDGWVVRFHRGGEGGGGGGGGGRGGMRWERARPIPAPSFSFSTQRITFGGATHDRE